MTDNAFPEESRAERLIELGHLTVSSVRDGAVHTLSLTGELDLANAGALERELIDVEGTDAETIVLDLGGLAFIDSTGIRLLLAADARARRDSDRLQMRRGPSAVARVLRIAGIDGQLPFVD
jgi:anti-anti-sigma factor